MIVVDPIKAFLSPVLQNREGQRNGERPCLWLSVGLS